jgi:hypothetical protein
MPEAPKTGLISQRFTRRADGTPLYNLLTLGSNLHNILDPLLLATTFVISQISTMVVGRNAKAPISSHSEEWIHSHKSSLVVVGIEHRAASSFPACMHSRSSRVVHLFLTRNVLDQSTAGIVQYPVTGPTKVY